MRLKEPERRSAPADALCALHAAADAFDQRQTPEGLPSRLKREIAFRQRRWLRYGPAFAVKISSAQAPEIA
jgi:hypothetical protein